MSTPDLLGETMRLLPGPLYAEWVELDSLFCEARTPEQSARHDALVDQAYALHAAQSARPAVTPFPTRHVSLSAVLTEADRQTLIALTSQGYREAVAAGDTRKRDSVTRLADAFGLTRNAVLLPLES